MSKPQIKCAVYTRKSSEEGLEQSFNSLEAQREACIAYIESQKHEGWIAATERYDDGGFSGGTMERPGLKRLLNDITAAKVQTVIVYKVDRLTRSLADFAKIIEVFDSQGVSFVSVTQQFNTTTSMGRLTLNVLLSFAQFERELTGERIRDKVAASKKKGMWMGGVVPLGYDCCNHSLVVNEAEAATVREIFRQYLRLGCVNKLRSCLEEKQIRSKIRIRPGGGDSGGAVYSRGALYHLLKNRIYIGEIVHREQSYPGQHQAIVEKRIWDQVAARLAAYNQAPRRWKKSSTPSMLRGVIFDTQGTRLTPTHAVKNGKRYRYYTSQEAIQNSGKRLAVTRFPAQELEALVISQIHLLLGSPDKCIAGLDDTPERDHARQRAADLAKRWPELGGSAQYEFIKGAVDRVVVGQNKIWIELGRTKLLASLLGRRTKLKSPDDEPGQMPIKLSVNFQPLRRGSELRLVEPTVSFAEGTPVPSLVKAIARARDWYERIISGEVGTVHQLARETGLRSTYVKRILECAMLSPQITETLLSGKHRPNLTLRELLQDVPTDWYEQRDLIAGS